jgi:hypothetical protein
MCDTAWRVLGGILNTARRARSQSQQEGYEILGLRQRNEKSFRQFHSREPDTSFRQLLVVHIGDEANALDSRQETLLRVARKCPRFDDEETFRKQ